MADTFTIITPPPITSSNYNILSIFNNFEHPVLGAKWETRHNKEDKETENKKKERPRQRTGKRNKTERAKSASRRKTMTFSNPCAHRKTFRRKNLVQLFTRYCTLILDQVIISSWYDCCNTLYYNLPPHHLHSIYPLKPV